MNDCLKSDIYWIETQIIPYIAISCHGTDNLKRLMRSKEMKNIFSSYGVEKLYKQDLERIVEMAEMLI